MSTRRIDILGSALALTCACTIWLVPWVPVRFVAVVPLALVLPGHAMVRAIFAQGNGESQPTRSMQLALVLALSLVTLILGSLLLDLMPGGLQRFSWAALLVAVTIIAYGFSVRRRRLAAPDASVLPRLTDLRIGSALLMLLALVIAVGAFLGSRLLLPAPNATGYTQLWMLPAAGPVRGVEIGIECDQLHLTRYRVMIRHGGRLRVWRVDLLPGRKAVLTVPVRASRGYVTATLYRQHFKRPYRQVRIANSTL